MMFFVTASLMYRSIRGFKFVERILAKWLEISGRKSSFSISFGRLCIQQKLSQIKNREQHNVRSG